MINLHGYVNAFVVSSANKYLDFKEDGGAELNATITPGSYSMGLLGTDSGSLCAAIKAALEAAGAGTYTVTFSSSTKKMTIAVAGGVAACQFLWKTGVHGSDNTGDNLGATIGFNTTANGASVASVTGDNALANPSITTSMGSPTRRKMTFLGLHSASSRHFYVYVRENSVEYMLLDRTAVDLVLTDSVRLDARGEIKVEVTDFAVGLINYEIHVEENVNG